MEALVIQAVEAPSESIPSSELDTLETSIDSNLPASYLDHRLRDDHGEWEASLNLYIRQDTLDHTDRATNFLDCRKYAWFTVHQTTRQVRVMANSCRLRWCPVCAQARFGAIRHSVTEWLKGVRNPKLFTVTMRHDSTPLQEQVDRLYKCFRDLRQHKGLKSRIRGGVWFFQLKRGKSDGRWHPHLHILLDADYIPKRDLSLEWFLTTGNSFIIDIRKVEDPEKVSEYVSRYCARPANLSEFKPDDQDEIYSVFKGRRLCGNFGTGHNCRLRPEKPADAADWLKLVSWKVCVENRVLCPVFQRVIRAWSKDEPLSEMELAGVSELVGPAAGAIVLSRLVREQQTVFEDFVNK